MLAFLTSAINERRTICISYDPGDRTIEPHALGVGSDGQVLLRAFQTEGATLSGESPGWKLFRVDRFNGPPSPVGSFYGPRPGYNRDDRAMKRRIIAQL